MTTDGPSRGPRSILSDAIAAAAAGAGLDVTLQRILETGAGGLGADVAAIFLQDPDRPGLTQAAGVGSTDPAAAEALAREAAHPFAETAATRVVDFERLTTWPARGSMPSAVLPMVVASGGVESSLGVLAMGWAAPRVLDDDDRDILLALASLAAIVADRERLSSTAAERSEWFERMAHTDPLTGLANERTVARILELELARAGRQGSELSLALFDVDGFRATNDSDGPEAGDDVLRKVAAVLAESVRLVDTVGRIGGDEFVLVAPGSAGGMVARRVQEGIAALPAVAGRTISVSAGIARFPADGTDPDALIASATSALARARDSGVGSVVESEAAPST